MSVIIVLYGCLGIMSMVDISNKPEVSRVATARGEIRLKPSTIDLIRDQKVAKGDPLYTAKVAGVISAKKTWSLIPLCHPIPLTSIIIDTRIIDESTIQVESTVKTTAQTGVEMEALVSVSTALLTIWDMIKQYEKDSEGQYPDTAIMNISVLKKVKGQVYE